jgi:hypothetical protein
MGCPLSQTRGSAGRLSQKFIGQSMYGRIFARDQSDPTSTWERQNHPRDSGPRYSISPRNLAVPL